MNGTVYFVGAGPGDPGLITWQGLRLLKKAGCVIYDRLVAPGLLRWTKPGCERVYVGKEANEAGRSQASINRLLVRKSRAHRIVVRLKGGDPTLFGRISEEWEALLFAKVPFKVVPGVSSAWAAAASAGIPLTDRVLSSSVAIVTGQEAQGKGPQVQWGRIGSSVDTLVILMGRRNLPTIVQRLLHAGRPASTPIALIRWATTARQEVLVSTLGRIEEELQRDPGFGPPLVAVIGEVVGLRERFRAGFRTRFRREKAEGRGQAEAERRRRIPTGDRSRSDNEGMARPSAFTAETSVLKPALKSSFQCFLPPRSQGSETPSKPLPLKGKRVLLTRPAEEREGLSRRLKALGARCVSLPVIAIRPRRISRQEAQALLAKLPKAHWILFTSHHGVEGLNRLASGLKRRLTQLVQGKVLAIGPRTLQAVRQVGLKVDLLPEDFSTAGIERVLRRVPVFNKRILIPRSNLGRGDRLAKVLRRRGACVEEPILYTTMAPRISPRQVRGALRRIHVATFTSASTVRAFFEALRQAALPVKSTFNGIAAVAIGPATAQALREEGISRFYLPKGSWTIDGLVEAVVEAVRGKTPLGFKR